MTERADPALTAYNIQAEDGLLFGCLLDGQGGGLLCDWARIKHWHPNDKPIWLHLDSDSPHAEAWLKHESGLPVAVARALLAKESRPRSTRFDEGLLVILRGVNLNAGSEPEDLVAIRMWVERNRIITVRYEKLVTPRDVLAAIFPQGHGPASAPALFVALAERLTFKMNDVIINLEDQLGELEGKVETEKPANLRSRLAALRQDCVGLRRHLSPQREALSGLQFDPPDWLSAHERMSLREMTDKTMRYLEDLDAARDRAIVVLDELANKMAESMNRTMYALSIVAAIFLPLSFLKGLLGINVGGMPGVESDAAFWITCAVMAVLMTVEIFLLKQMKWI